MIALTEATVRLGERPRDKEEAIRRAAALLGRARPHRAGVRRVDARAGEGRQHLPRRGHRHPPRPAQGPRPDPRHRPRRRAGARRRRVEPGRDGAPRRRPSPRPPTSTSRSSPTSPRSSPTTTEVAELVTTDDPSVVVRRLTRSGRRRRRPRPRRAVDLDGYAAADVVLELAAGLHARPATMFVDVAKGFDSDVRVRGGDKVANGKSLASLLSLGADGGADAHAPRRGPDQQRGPRRPRRRGRERPRRRTRTPDEDAAPAPSAIAGVDADRPRPSPCPASARHPGWPSARSGTSSGAGWSSSARPRTRSRGAQAARRGGVGASRAARPPRRRQGAVRRPEGGDLPRPRGVPRRPRPARRGRAASIRGGQSAGWAWREEIDEPGGRAGEGRRPAARRPGDRPRRRRQPGAAFLAEVDDDDAELPGHPVVLIADDLTPSDTAAIDPARVVGFCTAAGGPDVAHRDHRPGPRHPGDRRRRPGRARPSRRAPSPCSTARAARSGSTSTTPTSSRRAKAQQDLEEIRAEEHRTRYQPAITDRRPPRRGRRQRQPARARRRPPSRRGAEGVGLMRTEFLFLGRDDPPSEDEQYEALAEMVRRAQRAAR